MRFSDRTSNWIAGFGFGGFMAIAINLGVIGLVLLVAFLLPALRSRERVAAIAGLLVGGPGLWVGLVGLAAVGCSSFDAQPGQECVGPDLTGWYLVAAALLMAGILLTWREARARA